MLVTFVFTLAIGVTAGIYRERTGSLVPAVLVHTMANIGGTLPVMVLQLLRSA